MCRANCEILLSQETQCFLPFVSFTIVGDLPRDIFEDDFLDLVKHPQTTDGSQNLEEMVHLFGKAKVTTELGECIACQDFGLETFTLFVRYAC